MNQNAISILFVLVAIAGCSGGGGGPAPSGGQMVTEWYDSPANTQKKAEGPAVQAADGSLVRQGAWTEYFPPAEGGGVQWTRSYAGGVWSQEQAWTEFNADGSWRVDSVDR